MTLRFRYESAMPYITEESLAQYQPMVSAVHQILHERRGPGRDYLGWLDWPSSCGYQELQHIEKLAERIRHHSEALVVIGIGGSYIGSRAAIQVFTHHFHNQLPPSKRTAPQIYYVGHHLSSTYMADLLDVLAEKEFSINVISKSGTTIEPALAFRLFHQLIVKKYGPKGAKERILVTTDRERGALRRLAEEKGYPTFVIPDNIGGRYSVLTAVGLFPMAVAGIDIHEVLAGAREAEAAYADGDLEKNPSYQYAVIRNELYRQGKWLELLVYHEPSLIYLAEWWKQLFGESEGKDGKGIYPASVQFTTDLHALGQYIQSGRRQLFETMIQIEAPRKELTIPDDDQNLDELNYLAGRSIHYVNQQALAGSMLAHSDGGVPSLQIHLRSLNPFSFGHLVYFFQKACALSGYLLGVNPFDQPGVEAYKRNMFALLGRPGYEQEKERLESRLSRHFPGDG